MIIGAGPAGLGAAIALGKRASVLERDASPGGLCQTVELAGAVFDLGGHSFHTHHKAIRDLVFAATPMEEQRREAWCFVGGEWIPYPFQKNVHLALENEPVCKVATSEELLAVARSDKLNSLSFWFDVGNYCVVNGPRLDAPAALAPRIRYLQVKDFMPSNTGELTFCALGQGDIPIGQFLDAILPASPDPCVCVETDVREDRRDAIAESIAFLRSYALERRKG